MAALASPGPTLTGIPGSVPRVPTIGPSPNVGRLPALGWNSWYAYIYDSNEANVLDAANHIISLGLADAGYQYIIIDDGSWALTARNESTNQLVPDPSKFPNGIGYLADQVHSVGLKLGILADAGATCDGCFPGSLGNEVLDADTFAEWGLDYLKYNNGYVPANWTDSPNPPGGDWYHSNTAIRYRQIGGALNGTGRPFLFSIHTGGGANVSEWGARVAHSWRITTDVSPSWSSIISTIASNVQYLNSVDFYAHNDMDMIQIGNGDLTVQEQRTCFAAWAFLKSPLLLSTNLALLNAAQLAIIKNAELLAFNQDPIVGTPAKPFTPYIGDPTTSPPEYYAGQSSKGTHVFIINMDSAAATKMFSFQDVPGLECGSKFGSKFVVHDMWTGEGRGTFDTSFSTTIDPHDTAAFLITPAAYNNCH